ncbi:MAG: type II toxin-antitoxin system HicB family antitoxin [Nostoc sp. NMS7]|nr:type II toxin-antitoxin system HicB family antitoxin [Nostoc sp. NMS7]
MTKYALEGAFPANCPNGFGDCYSSVAELKQAFSDSVEDYLDFCRERGEEPDKPFSGKFMVRIDPDLHKKIVFIAKKEGQSLNSLVEKSLCLYAS